MWTYYRVEYDIQRGEDGKLKLLPGIPHDLQREGLKPHFSAIFRAPVRKIEVFCLVHCGEGVTKRQAKARLADHAKRGFPMMDLHELWYYGRPITKHLWDLPKADDYLDLRKGKR